MPLGGNGLKGAPGVRRNEPNSGMRLMIVLTAISVVLFTFGARESSSGGVFTTIRGAVSVVTTPVRYLGAAVTAPFQGLGNIFSNLTANQETLSDLKAENEKLQAENSKLQESQKTAERLESLLALQSTYNLTSVAARVISGPTDSWSQSVTIDKGTTSGLAVGMAVTDSNGVLGQITECGATSATVRLITDENSGVSCMIQSTRAQGMLQGSADGSLRLTLVSVDQTVKVGDNVVTSGLGGVYPKGLPVGKVTSVSKSDGALYYDIDVQPLASTSTTEEVLVITSLSEDQKASSEDISSADAQDTTTSASAASSDSSADSSASTGQ